MKFLKSLDSELGKKLKKVRIKTDPLWAEKLGLYNAPAFEGYVLKENLGNGMVKIFIVNSPANVNPIQQIPAAAIEPEPQPEAPAETNAVKNMSRLNLFKKAILLKLSEMGKCQDDPEVAQIINSNDVGFIETYLRQIGLNDEDLLSLYRKCIKRI
jgi:hypothetical protein